MHFCLNRATAGAGLPYDQFVQLAADAGFPGCDVELGWALMTSPAALRELFESRRLRYGGWGVQFNWREQEATWRDGMTEMEKFARVAAELGIDSCATWLLPSSDRPLMENWRFHVERLGPVAKVLREHGLRLGLEFVAPFHHRRAKPHEFIFTPGQMLELAADVGDNVGLLVDSFHMYTAGDTWEHLASIPKEKIVLVHINDAPKHPIPQINDFDRYLPGDGVIDLAGFVGALQQTGYAGPVSIEVFNEELKKLPPSEAAKKAWAACSGIGHSSRR
jgi:sugar phosphate isomerase/epimerase